jgi:predicted transcriptional regulator
MTEKKTLEVRVQPTEELHEEALEKVKAVERGEEVEDIHVLSLSSERELSRLMSEKNLELLHAIAEDEPSSMRELAEIVDRDFREVHRNLEELEKLNVVKFKKEGRAKKPEVWYDNIEVNVDLAMEA